MKYKIISVAISTVYFCAPAYAEVTAEGLPAMVVSAEFRPVEAQNTPISLTIIDSETIESRGAEHVEDVLNLAPNVNVASGASRGQFFQIRGIGERSQFAAPLNPSVGLYIDGIDFSRTGGAATLFDIEQIEILRGPQGTRFGANALAGVINMYSTQPTNELDVHVEGGLASYNTHNLGVAVSGPLVEDKLLGRLSVHSYKSDGYTDNHFLNRDNTQNRDELTAKGQLKWLVDKDLTVDLNVLHFNIDNGYDAFTFDNSGNTLTDQPGQDTLHTNAFALKTDWRASSVVQFQSAITYNKSDSVYSYDADWGYDGQFAPELFPYIGFEQFKRNRKNYSLELRALSNEDGRIFNNSTDWTVGFYHLAQDEALNQNSDFGVFGATLLDSQYDTTNTSVFGQLDTHLSRKLTLISGLRVEYFDADYNDSNDLEINTNEPLFGGKLGLDYQFNRQQLLYTSLSRGYKSGGVNTDARLDPSQRDFDTEYLWSLEAGLKSAWLNGNMITNLAAFYAIRNDAQVKSSIAVGPQFIDFIANAAKGKNFGLEADIDWLISREWRFFAILGLLHATFDDYDNPALSAEGVEISGRRQAHAPSYNFAVGGDYYFAPGWTFRANVEGKDEFYFSNSHNAKSDSYALLNSSIEYQTGDWRFTLWGRNLTDEEYATRGFFFGNDPSIGYEPRTYVQYGDPRVAGLSVTWDY